MPPAETASSHPTYRYLLWLGILILAVLVFFVVRIVFPAASPAMSTQATVESLVIPNAPMPADTDHVAAQKGFQYLVSYTDTGFSPGELSVKKGETVRFTNNASASIRLMMASESPQVIARGAYVEYTADTAGSFSYSDGTIVGTLTVTQ